MAAEAHLVGVTPVLRVRSLKDSIEYYTRVLGFKFEWGDEIFASVKRDRCGIFLSEGDQGNPGSWVWIGVDDVEALHREFQGIGAIIRHGPSNFPWALEMQVADPDGNVLRIGSDCKKGEPWGEWLDMRGDRWIMNAEGQWHRVATE